MSRSVDLGSLGVRLEIEQLEQTMKDLQKVSDEFDETGQAAEDMAKSTKNLEKTLDSLDEGLTRVSQGLMAAADMLEVGIEFIEEYGEALGLTEEQMTNLIGTMEEIQKPLMMGARAFIALADTMVVANWAIKKLSISMLTNPITLVLVAIAAAVTALYFAWKNNWGGIHDTFDRIWARLQPAFEGISRLLKRIGIDTSDMGKILDVVFGAIGWYIEFMLNPLIDALIILVGWLEKAAAAWDNFWGAQGSGTMTMPGSPRFTPTSNTYAPSYNNQTSTVYGGIQVYDSGGGGAEAGMNAFDIYTQRRRGG